MIQKKMEMERAYEMAEAARKAYEEAGFEEASKEVNSESDVLRELRNIASEIRNQSTASISKQILSAVNDQVGFSKQILSTVKDQVVLLKQINDAVQEIREKLE